jgi:ribosomal protein S15P/S13E
MQQLRIDLMHMELKYLEEFLKTNSKDAAARERLKELEKQFAELAQYAIAVD